MEFATAVVFIVRPSGQEPEVFYVEALSTSSAGRIDRFSSAVRTRQPVPFHLRVLAGLDTSDSSPAPDPEEVARALRTAIAGRLLVVAGPADAAAVLELTLGPLGVPVFHVCELAQLFRPNVDSADLSAIAGALNVSGADGRSPGGVDLVATIYHRFWELAEALDPWVLEEIVRRTSATSWPLRFFFREVATASMRSVLPPVALDGALLPSGVAATAVKGLTPLSSRRHTDPSETVACLESAVSGMSPRLEPRPQQVAMASAVTAALDGDYQLLVEAGTGTGKSLAYLLPAACLALRNDERVVVSTNTINLQQQIVDKDLPDVRLLLERFGPQDLRERGRDLRAEALKGRRNYLCLQRLAALRRSAELSESEARFLVRILLWLAAGGGDRSSLRLSAEEEPLWARVCAEGASCFKSANVFVRDGTCQVLQARRRAEAAHIVVVNHALLLSDIAAGRRVLPSYDRLIIDEAHNLEEEATAQLGFQAGPGDLTVLLDGILVQGRERETGLVIDVRMATWGEQAATSGAHLSELLTDLAGRVAAARERIPDTFAVLSGFVRQQVAHDGDYDSRLLLTSGTRAQPEWQQVELAWENLRLALQRVEDGLGKLTVALVESAATANPEHEMVAAASEAAQLATQRMRQGIEGIVNRADPDQIAWLTVNRRSGGVSFSSAPLSVASVLEADLFAPNASVVLTSATLTASGSFDYVQERLGLADAELLPLGSPFDYRQAALVLVPSDMPEPSRPQYQRAVEEAVIALCSASRGRALALFTSHGALRATAHAVRGPLAAAGIRTLAQGIDGSPQELIEALKANPNAAVLGTSSFWEGVDVVGDALSLLIIAKLPFSVPSDPVFTARAALFDDPFRDYALPQAVLRFKQGFGRLIRHRTDRGVVAVLDRRIRSKGYGRAFLQSLPDCDVREAPLGESARLVRGWLDRTDIGASVAAAEAPRTKKRR